MALIISFPLDTSHRFLRLKIEGSAPAAPHLAGAHVHIHIHTGAVFLDVEPLGDMTMNQKDENESESIKVAQQVKMPLCFHGHPHA